MEDETTEELSSSESEYSDSFIASDDDLEAELTWDSEDSRPPGPSPDSDPEPWNRRTPVAIRDRPFRRTRRVIQLPDNLSGNTSQEALLDSILATDSDVTYMSERSSPVTMSSSSPVPPELRDGMVGTVNLSPEYNPPSPNEPISPAGSPHPEPVAVEPQAPEDRPEELEVVELPPQPDILKPATTKPADGLDSSVLSEGEDASLCTICMCPLTNSGSHRVVCLKCGHIFGQACVERWIKVGCNNGARRCPTCNKKASLKDVRVLYLPKVVPLDTSERDRLMQEKEELAAQKKMLESDFTRTVLQHKLVVAKYEERIAALEKRLQEGCVNEGAGAVLSQAGGLTGVASATISYDGGCRVMAFNSLRQDLVVSQPSGNTVFAGFGVRVVNSVDWQPNRFVLLHSKAIRDLQFHNEDRDLLLSVSLDQNAKLFDLATNTTVHVFKGEGPLWSCCWDVSHPHLMLLGTQSGKVVQYDRRMTDHCVNTWETENNKTPVVALASTPCRAGTPFPQGGFLSCRLNTIYTYARQGEKYASMELAIDGPFMSMRYDNTAQIMLSTSRPSSRSPHTRVCLSLLDSDGHGQVCAPLIHTFNCGSSARVMSRSNTLPHIDDTLVVAHNESGRTLDVWSSKRGDHLHSMPVREPIIDLAAVPLTNNKPPLLAALSEKKLSLYRVN